MQAGDEKVVAERLYGVLSKPPKMPAAAHTGRTCRQRRRSVGSDDGRSTTGRLSTASRSSRTARSLVGTHEGEFASGDLSGTVHGTGVRFQSSLPTDGTRVSFQFEGSVEGGKMAGTVGLGEYGDAKWTAERHAYRTGGRRG